MNPLPYIETLVERIEDKELRYFNAWNKYIDQKYAKARIVSFSMHRNRVKRRAKGKKH
jgi:hypothetical protein